ncbi:MAG: hypothetical protein ACRD4U_08530 [Candidatus Acidiferrales bacterium]
MPHLPLAQVGLTDVTGGILVLLVAAAMALGGLVICAISLYYRKWILFIVGLALMSPALALVGYLLWEELPRSYEWDFSSDRSVARLDKEPTYGRYYYQGNLRTTIRLPGGRQWSGRAYLVTFDTGSHEGGDQIESIYWDGPRMSAEDTREEARRILSELGLAETAPLASSESIVTGNLDVWYEAARRQDWRNFNVETPPATAGKPGSNPRVNLYLRRRSADDEGEEPAWTLHVEVVWEE